MSSSSWETFRQSLIDAVKAHAIQQGWDVVVECYDDTMIDDMIGRARTPKGAIAKFHTLVSVHADRHADATNSAF